MVEKMSKFYLCIRLISIQPIEIRIKKEIFTIYLQTFVAHLNFHRERGRKKFLSHEY